MSNFYTTLIASMIWKSRGISLTLTHTHTHTHLFVYTTTIETSILIRDVLIQSCLVFGLVVCSYSVKRVCYLFDAGIKVRCILLSHASLQ